MKHTAASLKRIDKVSPDAITRKYPPKTTKVDWGTGKARGQGRRRGGMIMGGMSDAPQGVKSYTNLLGNVKDLDKEDADALSFGARGKLSTLDYLKARTAGLSNHEALVYAFMRDDYAPLDAIAARMNEGRTMPDRQVQLAEALVAQFEGTDWASLTKKDWGKKLANVKPSPWLSVASALFKKRTGKTRVDLGYRQYLLALMKGDKAQTKHYLTMNDKDIVTGAKQAKQDVIDARGNLKEGVKNIPLDKHVMNSLQLSISSGDEPKFACETAAMVAGHHAHRLGMSESELSKWLQSAYSSVFVKGTNLSPGLDMKDVRKLALSAYKKASSRKPIKWMKEDRQVQLAEALTERFDEARKPKKLHLWAYRHPKGWVKERDVTPDTADQWLAVWQKQEPDVKFTVAAKEPKSEFLSRLRNESIDEARKPKKPFAKCMECGRKFATVKAAERAVSQGCPGCGGSDVDIA